MHPLSTYTSGPTLKLSDLLGRMETELESAALKCTDLQVSISALLEKLHHPDLGEEIHMLQEIDRMQQTLVDIASVLRVASKTPQPTPISELAVGAAIRLESFRARIGLGQATLPNPPDTEDGETEVTWL